MVCISCDTPGTKSGNKDHELLKREIYTEDYIKSVIRIGMTSEKVEAIIGKPHRTDNFMGQMLSSYVLTPPKTKGLHIIEFTIVYKNEIVENVNMNWMGL
jgi:hypothetical protein